MICKICQSESRKAFGLTVLSKYPVSYFRCSQCGFFQTETPYWLKEAYEHSIAFTDTGILSRNIWFAEQTEKIIFRRFNVSGKFLDYGGGYGILTRLLRDSGFDFWRYDPHSPNLFAKIFDFNDDFGEASEKFELLTALEVFEHLEDPLIEIKKMLSLSDSLLFTTELIPPEIKDLQDWWYLAPETGQHISFYTKKSLEHLASSLKLHFYTNGTNLHLWSWRSMQDPFGFFYKISEKFRGVWGHHSIFQSIQKKLACFGSIIK